MREPNMEVMSKKDYFKAIDDVLFKSDGQIIIQKFLDLTGYTRQSIKKWYSMEPNTIRIMVSNKFGRNEEFIFMYESALKWFIQ
ncbi:MAG: hypothetical protein GX838_07020, partial [Clostridiaceae bacterium]|nr:hypothetical protein [Clostridiaceae bacterium]